MKQTRLLLALIVMIIPHKADAWSSMASQTYQKVQSAALAVEEYRPRHRKASRPAERLDIDSELPSGPIR